jgi:hypothetical protein
MVSWSSYQRWFWYHSWQHNRWCYRQLLGGWLGAKLEFQVVGGFSVASVVTAVLGAVVLVFVVSLIRRSRVIKLIYALA